MGRSSFTVLIALLALCGAVAVEAQVTTGSLAGLVTDESGDTALPGAQIEATYEPTGTSYSVMTQADGRYKIAGARAGGPYTVNVNMDGFEAGVAENIFVSLGETTVLNFGLQLTGVTDVVTVIGTTSALINPNRTGAGSNVGQVEIETLPSIGRGLEDFARSNPFFVVNGENEDPEAISVAGRSSRYNNIQIDGAVNNDLFGLADQGTPGGQADTTPISLDAIQEVQLVLAPFDVRQGGFTGGGVNAITRSGTNDFKGSAYFFTRDDSWVGDGPAFLGQFGEFSEDNYGFRVGGPISKSKAFFFTNIDISEREVPTGWSLDGSSGQCWANCRGTDEAAAFRNALQSRYGFDPGPLGEQTRETPSDKFFLRFDFNLNDSNTLTARHNYIDASNDVNRPGSFSFEWESETYDFQSETNSTVLQLNSVLSSTKFNEARLTFQSIKDRRAGVGQPFPWIEIENVLDFDTGDDLGEWEVGTEPFSTKNALDQDILEITNDFTWIKGNHTLTFGTHNELFSFKNLFIQNAFGAYEFRTLDDFLNDQPAREYEFTTVPAGQPEAQEFDVNQLGFYVGDQWSAKSNLTVTYGLRVDIPFFPDDPSRNAFTEQTYGFRTDELPDGEQLWSPRFGFNWDIKGDGKQQLRGGAGLFSGRTPYVWISNNYARTGVEQEFIRTFVGVPFNPDPNNQPTGFPGSGGEFNLIDPDFKFPTVTRLNLAYDRELPWWNLFLSVEGIVSESQDEIDYKDLNLVPTGAVQPFDGRPIFTRVDSNVSGAYLITNTSKGSASNYAVKVERRPGRGVWGFASYAYGDSNVVNDGTSSRAVSNFQFTEAVNPNNVGESPSDFEVRHRINAAIGYSFNSDSRYPTTVSAFYNAQSGRPYSHIYSFQVNQLNNDNYFSNDLLYVPSGPDDVIITNGTWDQLNAFIGSDECLDRSRGGIAPRNCSNAPWIHSLDVRIAQDIPIKNVNVQLSFDLFNLANFLDDDSGVSRYANFNAIGVVDFIGVTDDGRPIYSLDPPITDPENNDIFQTHNINSRWRAKLGARVSF